MTTSNTQTQAQIVMEMEKARIEKVLKLIPSREEVVDPLNSSVIGQLFATKHQVHPDVNEAVSKTEEFYGHKVRGFRRADNMLEAYYDLQRLKKEMNVYFTSRISARTALENGGDWRGFADQKAFHSSERDSMAMPFDNFLSFLPPEVVKVYKEYSALLDELYDFGVLEIEEYVQDPAQHQKHLKIADGVLDRGGLPTGEEAAILLEEKVRLLHSVEYTDSNHLPIDKDSDSVRDYLILKEKVKSMRDKLFLSESSFTTPRDKEILHLQQDDESKEAEAIDFDERYNRKDGFSGQDFFINQEGKDDIVAYFSRSGATILVATNHGLYWFCTYGVFDTYKEKELFDIGEIGQWFYENGTCLY